MDIQQLLEILIELRSASKQLNANSSEDDVKKMMHKYDMIFMGENFNCIDSIELAHSIDTIFAIHIDNDELNKLIPSACKAINMKYDPMINVANISNPNPKIACYRITLW